MIALLLASDAWASPLNPWGSLTAEGATTLAPYVYASASAVSSTIYVSRGVRGFGDVYAGVGGVRDASGAVRGIVEVFPRVSVGTNAALVPHVVWGSSPTDRAVALEAHTWGSHAGVSWVGNVGWRRPLYQHAPTLGTLNAAVAPEVSITNAVSLFVEVDPSVALETVDVDVLLVPGVSCVLGPHREHTAVVALQWSPVAGPSVGASWTTTLTGRR